MGGGGFFHGKWGICGKIGVFKDLGLEIWGFGGKMGVLLKNGVFVGFWSRNWEKVGKSREFDDFWKIGKNREK